MYRFTIVVHIVNVYIILLPTFIIIIFYIKGTEANLYTFRE